MNRAVKADRSRRREIAVQNRRTAAAANSRVVSASAAEDLALLLGLAESRATTQGPDWVEAADGSRRLFYFGGIVCCVRSGAMAQRSIARSKLRAPCTGHRAAWQDRELRKLASGRLPRTEYKTWPDGGADAAAGIAFRRIER